MPAFFSSESYEPTHLANEAAKLREACPQFAAWAKGNGVILHSDLTQLRVAQLLNEQEAKGKSRQEVLQLLEAADQLANAAKWLVVHATYTKKVNLDGSPYTAEDFKIDPQGHTGGSLNMVPAYVGYLLANLLSGHTRSWLMEQGHCVAAIDSANLLVNNLTAAHAQAYGGWNEAGLTKFVQDFYSYELTQDGKPASPLGSHANVNTAGAVSEGGYLGFTGLNYVHASEKGERLVAFLSDGAFEEQRGSDWAAKWWRAEDTGWVTPVMIANGRRIDQRSTLMMQGGVEWFAQYLSHQGFNPCIIDGTDPAAFAWAILASESWLQNEAAAISGGKKAYPARLPYVIAASEKGYGFPGAGTNLAHGTPLPANPAKDAASLRLFNEGAARLWQEPASLAAAAQLFQQHEAQNRPQEKDHPLAQRKVNNFNLPEVPWLENEGDKLSPMAAADVAFSALIKANPHLRPRLGNPDEISSNNFHLTLAKLKHRVTQPETALDEALDGCIITALNEEAVVSAMLANKGGINLSVSYEAFSVKMLGALRQEIIFARHQKEAGQAPEWRSMALISSSHLWENGKNEQSHQDPSLAEILLGEMNDVSRVIFPADANSAAAALIEVYAHQGQLANLIIPKRPVAKVFSSEEASLLVKQGAILVAGDANSPYQLVAVGAYQLEQAQLAWRRLADKGVAASLVYLQEPGKYRFARDAYEAEQLASDELKNQIFPNTVTARVFATHTRPEPLLGHLRSLDLGPSKTSALGYINRGGTLDVNGLLLANACSWAHLLAELAKLSDAASGKNQLAEWLTPDELAAIEGKAPLTNLLAIGR